MIDLHIHTVASDGDYTPEEMIEMVKKIGITTIAVTDHDSAESVEKAIDCGKKEGISVIPGIEMTAYEEDKEIHVLGYDIDYNSPVIRQYEKDIKELIAIEENSIFEELNKLNIPIKREDTEQYKVGKKFNAKQVVNWLVHNGYGEEGKTYAKYFIDGPLKDLKRRRMPVKKAIDLIYSLNGIPVLAHPCRLGIMENTEVESRIKRYIEYGLQGVEAFYCMHSDEQVEFLKDVAKRYNLLITMGSDYHGPSIKKFIELGVGINKNLEKYQNLENTDSILKNLYKSFENKK